MAFPHQSTPGPACLWPPAASRERRSGTMILPREPTWGSSSWRWGSNRGYPGAVEYERGMGFVNSSSAESVFWNLHVELWSCKVKKCQHPPKMDGFNPNIAQIDGFITNPLLTPSPYGSPSSFSFFRKLLPWRCRSEGVRFYLSISILGHVQLSLD